MWFFKAIGSVPILNLQSSPALPVSTSAASSSFALSFAASPIRRQAEQLREGVACLRSSLHSVREP